MKTILLIAVAFLFLLGCNALPDKVKPFIPGTYQAQWKTAFSIAVDTMNIALLSDEVYIITRRIHVQFINEAKQRAPEYSIAKWQGIYSGTDKTLVIQSNGRVMNFDFENKTLRMGAIIYHKL